MLLLINNIINENIKNMQIKKNFLQYYNLLRQNKKRSIISLIVLSLIIASFFFILKYLKNFFSEISKLNQGIGSSFYFLSIALLVFCILTSFLYYYIYNPRNTISFEEINNKLNVKNDYELKLKTLYESNEYSKVKQLVKIRWAFRIGIFVILTYSIIILKYLTNSLNNTNLVMPIFFSVFLIFLLIVCNNFLSYNIEKDIKNFDKKITNTIQSIDIKNINNEFVIFNQLILERNLISRSIYIDSFQESINDTNQIYTFKEKLRNFFCKIIAISQFISNNKNESIDHKSNEINNNFDIFKGIINQDESKNLILSENDSEKIKDLNKDSELFESKTFPEQVFVSIDFISKIPESVYQIFVK